VAVVAEVAADASGGVRVLRVFCAHDCGLVVNPDQVESQIEGNVVWGCSMALHERAEIADGQFAADNFHSYPILRNDAAPDIRIRLIESNAAPAGVGEPAIAPTPPAITNALFAASGRRVRDLPIL
jgi:isoquinoline 1-oxidoreductase beta subunit